MTEKEAVEIAKRNGCEHEVMEAILDGFSPREALVQYDCLPDIYSLEEVPGEEEIDIMLDQDEMINNMLIDD